MLSSVSKNWWVFVLRGIFAIIFGILVLVFPGIALVTFVLYFAAYALVDGVFTIWSAIQRRDRENWWVHLLEGIVSIIAGIVAFLFPGITALTLLYVIAAWAIVTGVLEIWAAIQLRKEIEGEFWLGLGGLLSIIFGILLIVFPGSGALAVLTLIAAYSIVFGVMMILLGFRLRSATPTGTTSDRASSPV
mgnify:CR=1 FL=1